MTYPVYLMNCLHLLTRCSSFIRLILPVGPSCTTSTSSLAQCCTPHTLAGRMTFQTLA